MAYLNGLGEVIQTGVIFHPSINNILDPQLAGGKLGFGIPVKFKENIGDDSGEFGRKVPLTQPFSKKLPANYSYRNAFNNLGLDIFDSSNFNVATVTSDGTLVIPGISELGKQGKLSSSGWLLGNSYFQLGNDKLPQPCGVQQSARNFWNYGLKAVSDPSKIYYSELFGYYTPVTNIVNLNACKSASFLEAALPIIKFVGIATGINAAVPFIGQTLTSGLLPSVPAAPIISAPVVAPVAPIAPSITSEQIAINAAQAAAESAASAAEPVSAAVASQGLKPLLSTAISGAGAISQVVGSAIKIATGIEAIKALDKAPLNLPSNYSALPDTGPNAEVKQAAQEKPLTNLTPYVLFGITALLIFSTRPKNAGK